MFWMAALTGGGASGSGGATDSNGVPLPNSSNNGGATPAQEVATHGPAVISGTLNATDCKDINNVQIPCSTDTGLKKKKESPLKKSKKKLQTVA